MGLSFHYSGSFKRGASLTGLIEEVKDIAETQQWNYSVFETAFPGNSFETTDYNKENLYGVSISPPGCEPVWLCFLSNGKLGAPHNLMFYDDTDDPGEVNILSVKTQYAGIEIHVFVIQLLKYIAPKYLDDFTLRDEGQYWETGDIHLLQEIFERYTNALNTLTASFEGNSKLPGETIENYLERVLNKISADRDNNAK